MGPHFTSNIEPLVIIGVLVKNESKKDYFKLIKQQMTDLNDTGRLIVRSLFKLSFFKTVIQELAIRTP